MIHGRYCWETEVLDHNIVIIAQVDHRAYPPDNHRGPFLFLFHESCILCIGLDFNLIEEADVVRAVLGDELANKSTP